jgi:hypothetical protein
MKDEGYRPVSRRQAVWIALAAVTTAITIVLTMLAPPGGAKGTRQQPAGPQPCAKGQVSNCVGGKIDVILPAASAPASAAPGSP